MVAAALFAGMMAARAADEVDLSEAPVYVSANATCPEIEAARLFLRAQRMIAGGTDTTNLTPQVAAAWPSRGVVIGWQGSALLKPLAKELDLKPWKEMKNHGDRIVQVKKGNVYVLAGNAPECAYFAVADLLYRNGARFIHLGRPEDGFEGGTFLEWMKGLKAPASRSYTPYVARRTGFALAYWDKSWIREPDAKMIAMNGFAIRNCTSPEGPLGGGYGRASIGCESIQPPVNDYEQHPEWFPLVDGKRWRPAPGGWVTEGCWTCPGFADWVVQNVVGQFKRGGGANRVSDLNLTNSDGGPKCRCESCQKYRAQFPDDSSWYWDYHAKLAKRIEAEVPGLYRYTFAYINSLCFPKGGKKAVAHLDAIQYCPYQRCYVHPYSDKTCRTNRTDMDRAEEWRKAEIPIGDFDYCYDVFNPSMNMPNWNITWDVVRYWKELNGDRGVPSVYMECATWQAGCGGKSRASVYVVARALWDCAEEPAETHLQDFCRCGFGDAAPEMLEWYHACAKAWETQQSHLTATFNNPTGTAKGYFSEELAKLGAKAFASAEKKIRARMAPAGTPAEKLTREQNLAAKQYATWAWEKKYAYDEWVALRKRALTTSLVINAEMGDASDAEFARMPEYKMKPHWGGTVDNNATVRLYRTKDALRLRIRTVNPNLKPVAKTTKTGDDDRAYADDHIELFLQAPGKSDYFHLCVGLDGSRYDALCKDEASFTSADWKSEVKVSAGSAEYTVTIPWTMFGADHKPVSGNSYKLLAVLGGMFPNQAKPGEMWMFFSGLPSVSFHDPALGVDVLIDDNAGRRAGGLGLAAFSEEKPESFEEYERRVCLKPGPSPMDAVPRTVALTPSDGKLARPASDEISLDGTWKLYDPERDPVDMEVPGSVHTALVKAGRLPDPFFSTNDALAAEASFHDWRAVKTFTLKEEDVRGPLRLEFGGVCDECLVLLNGRQLGRHEGMFGGPDFDVTGRLRAGENRLEVYLRAAPRWKPDAAYFWHGPNDNQGWRMSVVFNCCYGWHYARIPARGIWRSVKIRKVPAVEVLEPFVATKALDGTLDFHAVLRGRGRFEGRLLGEIRPLNFKGRAEAFSVAAAGEGEQTVRLRFKVSDPHLWWPAGHGEQNLYAMTLRFEDASGRATDGTGFQFGIRTIEMRPAGGPDAKPAPDTYNWLTVVNGKPIFLKGTGWCTMDPLMRFTKDRYERFLGAAHRQNANFIRAWGCGIVESEEFYDLCDRYGICVMQKWPTAWDSYPTQPKEALAETVIRGTRRLRNRPSLVFWCGGNEGKAPLFDTPTYSVENLNLIGRLTYENDGTRPWHRQEGWSGGSYHDYSASWDGKNPAVMMTKESKFFGEFGVDCLPSAESIRKYTPADELAELERTKGTADWKIGPTGAIAHHTPKFNHAADLKRQLQHVTMTLPCDSLENAVLGSQIGQALGVRYTLERSRTRFPACAGASMYKLNDIYPAASWATVDWYGTEKYASFVVADAFKPLTAIARLERLRSEGKPVDIPLFVVDDGDELAGTKAWTVSLRALDAKLKGIRRLDVRGAGSVGAVRRLGELKLSAEEAASVPLWVVAEVVADGRTVARNFYYVNFEAECGCLFRMPQTTLDAKAADGAYVIRNTGDVPAINVHFVCPKVSDRFVCEDNYFWLEPREERRIEVNFTEGVEGVRCWNLRQ